MDDDLHKIANCGSFGSGKKARDRIHANVERRKMIPKRKDMNELVVATQPDALVASFGNDGDDGLDYHINSMGYAAIRDDSTAGQEARAIAALWNAYRAGELIWSTPAREE